jgi:TetR/AcrR family transcriptional regulator, tetracycline repressor protein
MESSQPRPKRGRRPAAADNALTKERIVRVALGLLDAGGLAAFSVRDVAKALDVYPAAVYWHVRTRNQLLVEIVAHVLCDLAPTGPRAAWQDWLRELFGRYRAAIRLHPNVAPLIGAQLVSNASLDFDLLDQMLEVLSHAGFTGAPLIEAFSVVIAAQVGFVTLEFAPPPPENPAEWAAEMQALVYSVDPVRHPLLARHLDQMANRSFTLRWQSGVEVPMDRNFKAYVETVIAGLEAMAARSRMER